MLAGCGVLLARVSVLCDPIMKQDISLEEWLSIRRLTAPANLLK